MPFGRRSAAVSPAESECSVPWQLSSTRYLRSSLAAYTVLALALTIILKKCRLSKVNAAERNGTMQTVERLGSEHQNSLTRIRAWQEA